MTAGQGRDRAPAVLTIDLDAIVENWRSIGAATAPAEAAAVVKADAYGLGAAEVAPALAAAGCRTFFVATLDEGIALRGVLGGGRRPHVYVLEGPPPGCEEEFVAAWLRPVLNTPEQIDGWAACAARLGGAAPAGALHLDTGMSRLGLSAAETEALAAAPARLAPIRLGLVMSHFACADEPFHPKNDAQTEAFARLRSRLPAAPWSLANSAGCLLDRSRHGALVRPGIALYGGAPQGPASRNPMRGVVRLAARILQVRSIDAGETVGYGASYVAARKQRIATVGAGYADGLFRSLGNRGAARLGDFVVPLIGRVSMDLVTFDVSAAPESLARPGAMIELIGPNHPVDALAAEAGTISYEILTALGRRYRRVYLGAAPTAAGSR